MTTSLDLLRTLHDNSAACDGCGRLGTIARATRLTDPPSVARYCSVCWPGERRRRLLHLDERRAAIVAGDPDRLAAAQVEEHLESCSWLDVQDFLSQALSNGPIDPGVAAEWARAYAEWAPLMDGPIPEMIQRFIERGGLLD